MKLSAATKFAVNSRQPRGGTGEVRSREGLIVNYQSAESSRVESQRRSERDGTAGGGEEEEDDIPAGREGPEGLLNDVSG